MSKSVLELTPVETVACCSPLATSPLTADEAERIAPLLKALADPVRLRLLSMVAAHQGKQACVCELQESFDLSQPTISHHTKALADAGLITGEKRGRWVWWSVVPERLDAIRAALGG